ncbi:MAG: hypothetical protein EA350_09360 [Gemmatimonadales bacterium]|nr:MAG: hypothetical protein EA350_09360 [Gemmatimonadales bacterium]
MTVERFAGPDLPSVMLKVHRAMGPDAMVLRSGPSESGGVEVLVADPDEVEALRRQIEAEPAVLELRELHRARPPIVAFVGAAGSGKTTVMMKLAVHRRAYGGRKVGILSLDTWSVGGVEEIRMYAEVAGFPLEVVHHPDEVEGAIRRLGACEVILVDTPGRLEGDGAGLPEWIATLQAVDPDEVHWVCPVGLRPAVVRDIHRKVEPCRPTHVLLSRLDEASRDGGSLEVARAACLPARWVSEGAEVPGPIRPALPGLMASLNLPSHADAGTWDAGAGRTLRNAG